MQIIPLFSGSDQGVVMFQGLVKKDKLLSRLLSQLVDAVLQVRNGLSEAVERDDRDWC